MAGLVAANLVKNCRINSETYKSSGIALDFDAALLGDESVAAGASVQPIAGCTFTAAKLVFLYLLSDQDITLTFTLGTGTLEIGLKAGFPWVWENTYEDTIPNPFEYDSVSCTAANEGTTAATLAIRGGLDA